jgi:hypothetical protein
MTPARCFNGAVSTTLVLLLLSLVVTDAVRRPSAKLQTRHLQSPLVTTVQSHGKGKSKKSQAPSEAPSVSPAPTHSVSPSSAPTRSQAPSAAPSPTPTGTPTYNPTQSPTTSFSPTPLPFVTVAQVDDSTGDVERFSECTRAVPSTATAVADVVLNFDYKIFITEAVDVAPPMSTVESRLHPMLADRFLDCQFDGDTPFEVRAISSFPVDQLYQACAADDQVFGSDCYIIDAGITVEIFYLNERRFLQVDGDVLSSFGTFLSTSFGDGGLIESSDDIIDLKFMGFTNGARVETFSADDDDAGTTVAGIGSAQPADGGNSTVLWSSLLVGAAAVCLVVVALLAARRRKGGKDSKELADMVVLEDDLSDDGTGSSGYYTGSLSRGRQGRYVQEQPANKVLVLSDNMDAYDDNRTSGGYDIDPQWSPRAYGEDHFNPPTFVATDATDHNRKMSLKSLRSPPRGYASRAYVSSDTVDL